MQHISMPMSIQLFAHIYMFMHFSHVQWFHGFYIKSKIMPTPKMSSNNLFSASLLVHVHPNEHAGRQACTHVHVRTLAHIHTYAWMYTTQGQRVLTPHKPALSVIRHTDSHCNLPVRGHGLILLNQSVRTGLPLQMHGSIYSVPVGHSHEKSCIL